MRTVGVGNRSQAVQYSRLTVGVVGITGDAVARSSNLNEMLAGGIVLVGSRPVIGRSWAEWIGNAGNVPRGIVRNQKLLAAGMRQANQLTVAL